LDLTFVGGDLDCIWCPGGEFNFLALLPVWGFEGGDFFWALPCSDGAWSGREGFVDDGGLAGFSSSIIGAVGAVNVLFAAVVILEDSSSFEESRQLEGCPS
jgi:hypothetical protein